MSDPHSPPEVPPEIRWHVETVLGYLLRADELDRWDVRWIREEDRGFPWPGPNERGWILVADIVARGESFLGYLQQENFEYAVADRLDTFTDGLEDFIAESRFAWGQQREMHDRPWHRPWHQD